MNNEESIKPEDDDCYATYLREIKNLIAIYHLDIKFSSLYSAASRITTKRFSIQNHASFIFILDQYFYEDQQDGVTWYALNHSHLSAVAGEDLFNYTEALILNDSFLQKERDVSVFSLFLDHTSKRINQEDKEIDNLL